MLHRVARPACLLLLAAAAAACSDARAPEETPAPAPAETAAAPAPAPEPASSPEPEPEPEPAPVEPPAVGAESAGTVAIGAPLPAFRAEATAFVDGVAQPREVASQAGAGVTVWVVSSTTCPYVKAYVPRLKALESEFAERGVGFVHLYPNGKETDEAKTAFHRDNGLQGSMVLDAGAAIAKRLGAQRTPEVYVTDAAGVLRYQGGVDGDWQRADRAKPHLRNALEAVLEGRAVAVEKTVPAG